MRMPVKATPYRHQQEAFEFACELFGVAESKPYCSAEGGDAESMFQSQGCFYLMDMG